MSRPRRPFVGYWDDYDAAMEYAEWCFQQDVEWREEQEEEWRNRDRYANDDERVGTLLPRRNAR